MKTKNKKKSKKTGRKNKSLSVNFHISQPVQFPKFDW